MLPYLWQVAFSIPFLLCRCLHPTATALSAIVRQYLQWARPIIQDFPFVPRSCITLPAVYRPTADEAVRVIQRCLHIEEPS